MFSDINRINARMGDLKSRLRSSSKAFWQGIRHPAPQGRIDVNYLLKWLLLGAIIGVGAGLAAIAFHRAIELVTTWTLGDLAGFKPPQPLGEGQDIISTIARRWAIPLITALGGLLAGFVVYKLAPEAEGHGTDTAIDAYHNKNGNIRWRIPYVKFVASTITIGTGGSAGPEGPASQMGAGFGSFIAQIMHLSVDDRRIAVAAGMGAGIAAIFKAPLGGGILAAEILYLQGMESEVLIPAFISCMIAYVVYASAQGFTPIFGTGLNISFTDPISLVMMAFLGAVGHVPLAVMVMIAEITGSYQLLAPAMIAVGLAYVIIGNNTMYHSQVLSPAESPAHRDKYSYPLLNRMQVKEAMRTKVLTLSPDATIADAASLMQLNGIKGIPVIDTNSNLVGIITNIDVMKVPQEKWPLTRVKEIMSTDLAVIRAGDRLDYALNYMRQRNIGHLPVVDDKDPKN